MIYAVIDTNVFVSSFLTRHDDAATLRVVRAMGAGSFVPLYNDEILTEYYEVLSRDRFGIAPVVVEALIEKIREIGCFADPVPSGKEFLDEEDRVFYEVTLAHAEENAKLVTGNARHFPVDPIVISAAQFCEIIGA